MKKITIDFEGPFDTFELSNGGSALVDGPQIALILDTAFRAPFNQTSAVLQRIQDFPKATSVSLHDDRPSRDVVITISQKLSYDTACLCHGRITYDGWFQLDA